MAAAATRTVNPDLHHVRYVSLFAVLVVFAFLCLQEETEWQRNDISAKRDSRSSKALLLNKTHYAGSQESSKLSKTPLAKTTEQHSGVVSSDAGVGEQDLQDDQCRRYRGILHIQHGDPWAAGCTVFFLYVMNYLMYAEQYNLLPWVHLDDFSERVYDPQVHGLGQSRSFPIPSRLRVTYNCGHDQICRPKRNAKINETITVEGNGVWDSYFEPVSSFSLDNPCYLPYLTFTEDDTARMHYGWTDSLRAWYYLDTVPLRPTEGHLHEWYGNMRAKGARIAGKYLKPKPWLVEASRKANPSEKCMAMHVRLTDKAITESRSAIGVDLYLPYATAYAEAVPDGSIYLASDSSSALRQIEKTWPKHVVDRIITQPAVLQSSNETAVFDIGSHHRTNAEVLTDVYAMSKCNAFLHGHSSVSESVLYLNLNLHNCSVDLEDPARATAREFQRMLQGDNPRCG